MLRTGILSQNLIEDIKKLVFTTNEKEVVDQLGYYAGRLRDGVKWHTFFHFLSVIMQFLLFLFATQLSALSRSNLIWFFLGAVALQVFFVHYMTFKIGVVANKYKRLIEAFLDNVIFAILDDFRISLASELPRLPDPKELSLPLSEVSLQSIRIASDIGRFAAILVSTLALFVFYFVTGNSFYLTLGIIVISIVSLFVIYTILGLRFYPQQKDFLAYTDSFDVEFRATQPLLFRASLDYYPKEFSKKFNAVVATTTYINAISNTVTNISPIIFVFVPLLFTTNAEVLLAVALGFFIASKTFGSSTAVGSYFSLKLAEERVGVLDNLISTVLKIGSELTPDVYEHLKRSTIKKNPGQQILDTYQSGDLNILNLEYLAGRGGNQKKITLPKTTLKASKVNFLTGASGSGKSIFGRLLTLRYSDFDASFVGIKGSDIRTFRTLDRGRRYLHFSGLRTIRTSYRQAIGSYLLPNIPQTLITQKLNLRTVNMQYVFQHFYKNQSYYEALYPQIEKLLNEYKSNPKVFTAEFNSLSDAERRLIAQCYKAKLNMSISPKLFIFALVMEFYAFAHMKTFIPEATMYYVDAILSEPPISQGERRRILFALDLLVEGSIFVVDEPFSNLDSETSKKVLISLINYAKTHNSVVLVLDQEVNSEILASCRPSSLGTFLHLQNGGNEGHIFESAGVNSAVPIEPLDSNEDSAETSVPTENQTA